MQKLCRPSKTNKSPYLADIQLTPDQVEMAHSPALGLSGLI